MKRVENASWQEARFTNYHIMTVNSKSANISNNMKISRLICFWWQDGIVRPQLVQGKSSECNENVNERQTNGRHVLICDVGGYGYAWTWTELELLGSAVALMEISSSISFESLWLLLLFL